ncbi:hypothetical protein PITCH_A1220002 [uncultured Desulfobacterium sp.]|uniref:Intein C-terminal splicing domain-containing protein n=1 Tax=uncultured Desulfobacterium sp. TaxID=201089 RepID=A0A445MRT5_9BACT|nr:hypothetical protein PITCH_A1220002 [uncultured Desulfobacterium sp.]
MRCGEKISSTTEHPYWVTGRGWTAAGKIIKGDEVLDSKENCRKAVTITRLSQPQQVFNFEVAGWHSYFVGNCGVWVHNSCIQKPVKVPVFDGRQIVFVKTSGGKGKVRAFYKSTGTSGSGIKGEWYPFEGIAEIIDNGKDWDWMVKLTDHPNTSIEDARIGKLLTQHFEGKTITEVDLNTAQVNRLLENHKVDLDRAVYITERSEARMDLLLRGKLRFEN